jgi:hypothetical protein
MHVLADGLAWPQMRRPLLRTLPISPHRDYRTDSGGARQARAAAHDTYPK